MDDKAINPKLKFPEFENSGKGYSIPDLNGASLLPACENNQQNSVEQRRLSVLQLLWQAIQKPLSKIGLIILFLAFIMILTPNAPVLSWIGIVGVLASATMIGLSLFNTRAEYLRSMQNNSDNSRSEFIHDSFDPT